MNTQSITITSSPGPGGNTRLARFSPMEFTARIARLSIAGAAALAVVIAGTWAALTPSMAQVLSALLWGTGLLFFALAIETNIRRVLPVIATGLALPVLAVLGSRVAAEFSVAAVVILAAWLAIWITRAGRGR